MLRVSIINRPQDGPIHHGSGPIEFGRWHEPLDPEARRIEIQDDATSKDHLRVEQPSEGVLKLENLSRSQPVTLTDSTVIPPGGRRTFRDPVLRVQIGNTQIDLEILGGLEDSAFNTISAPVLGSGQSPSLSTLFEQKETPDAATLAQWLETLVLVQRSAAGSAEFYDETAQAVVDLIGFDRGLILLRDGMKWNVAGSHREEGSTNQTVASQRILDQVLNEKRTFYEQGGGTHSLAGVSVVAASPIFDGAGEEVVGVVYGVRDQSSRNESLKITPLEAQLLQVLAATISSGRARIKQEAEACRRKAEFEQFFGSALADELERDHSLLDGRDHELTILFCDIRRFSTLATQLTPRETCELVSDVWGCVTPLIQETRGTVVHYIGDGLLAMWNAPLEQADHVVMACKTVLQIQAALPSVSLKWEQRIDSPIKLGIGLHVGPALVGNTGSKYKFQYGPLGHSVNLGSRVEGATKQLGVPVLITGSTRERIGESFATRRLCRARVVGIDEPVDLYELHGETATDEWLHRRDEFEAALRLFENGQWGEASQRVYPLLTTGDEELDIPSLILASRVIDCLKSQDTSFDPVMTLESK